MISYDRVVTKTETEKKKLWPMSAVLTLSARMEFK